MPYRVEISPAAARELIRIPPQDRDRLELVIASLKGEPRPRGARKVKGREGVFRVRVGGYRVVYRTSDDEHLVLIIWAGRRSESTYRRL